MTKKRRPLRTGPLIGKYFKFPEDLWDEFAAAADEDGVTYSDVMRDAAEDYISKHKSTRT